MHQLLFNILKLSSCLSKYAVAMMLPIVLIGLWFFITNISANKIIPGPQEVANTLWDLFFGGVYDDSFSRSIFKHLLSSIMRVYSGFFLAVLIALPLGLLIGRVKLIRDFVDPTLQILRPIPVTAWLPLSMIFFGLGSKAAVFLVFLGAFYPVLLNTIFGAKTVEPRLIEAAIMLGCDKSDLFRKVIFPASLPSIFTGLRLGNGFAWILIVVGEMTGVPDGLGALIMDGRSLSRTDLVIAGMIIIGILGFLSDRVLVIVNNYVLNWNVQYRG